jgi:hypothetical protein
MSASINANVKKRGRPKTTGTPLTIGVRLPDNIISALDNWIAANDDPKWSRSEAVRFALSDWLSSHGFLPIDTKETLK